VPIFRELRRVLRRDGVLWLNLGDSYAASGKGGGGSLSKAHKQAWGDRKHLKGWRAPPAGYKQKDLVGIPWLVAQALRQDGWFLRRDIVWDKGTANEPPRVDRPSGSHEMLFLFSRSQKYAFDQSALPHGTVWRVRPSAVPGHSATFPPSLIEPLILASSPVDGMVLDPFGGAGTTGLAAERTGRNSVLIELNPVYAALAQNRILADASLLSTVEVVNA
jgi:site-specific DNA-methyltransferase (adenine-specific)